MYLKLVPTRPLPTQDRLGKKKLSTNKPPAISGILRNLMCPVSLHVKKYVQQSTTFRKNPKALTNTSYSKASKACLAPSVRRTRANVPARVPAQTRGFAREWCLRNHTEGRLQGAGEG